MNKLALYFCLFLVVGCNQKKPDDFKVIQEEIPSMIIESRYFSSNNFIGKPIDGYLSNRLMLTEEATAALQRVQENLLAQKLSLKIFDAYRPQRAVDQFVDWCEDETDTVNKKIYYPNLEKSELLPGGYIAAKSGHSRGSTVDLTIVYLEDFREFDMGTPYDYFGKESHGNSEEITTMQQKNRRFLDAMMRKEGFERLPEEWWHFTLKNEPYPDTYFDFVID